MTGADYIARAHLSQRDGDTLADIGETCERVPAELLSACLRRGWIAPIVPPPPAGAGDAHRIEVL